MRFLIILLLLPTLARAEDLPPWAARNTSGAPVRIAVPPPAEKKFAHLAWPKVTRASDGTIVLAYLAALYHGGGGCPAVSISTDDGKTFGAPHILREFGKDKDYANSGNLAVAVAEDKSLVLLAMAHTGDTASNIFGWRSIDNARTWKPVDTSSLGPDKTGSVTSMMYSPGAGLVAVGHYRKPSKPNPQGIWFAISRDHGQTWGAPSLITDVNAGEPVIVQADQRWLVFIRSRDVPRSSQILAVSDDKGKTWKTQFTEIGTEKGGTLTHPFAMLNPDDPAQLIMLTAERPLPGKVWLWRGNPQTLKFNRDKLLLEFPRIEKDKNDDFGYPCLLPIARGKALMFYYHGQNRGPNPIWVTEIGW